MADTFPSSDPADDPLGLFAAEADTPQGKPTPEEPASAKFVKRAGAAARRMFAEPTPTPGTEPAHGLDDAPAADAQTVRLTVDFPPTPPPLDPINGHVTYATAAVLDRIAASVPEPTPVPHNMAVEFIGPPPPVGSVSFDHVCAVKGLGFVEGIALIQATVDAIVAVGPSAGVPELHGLFLTSTGDVVLNGPPTGEHPGRELARLLHQMIAPNLMPPAGRLFVGRWINNENGGITEFASELAYFARPNGRELLLALHGRCDPSRGIPAMSRPQEPRRSRKVQPKSEPQREDAPRETRKAGALITWIRAHKAEVTAAAVVLVAATLAALGTVLFTQRPLRDSSDSASAGTSAPAAPGVAPAEEAAAADTPTPRLWFNPPAAKGAAKTTLKAPPRLAVVVRDGTRPSNPSVTSRRRTGGNSAPLSVESQDATRDLSPAGLAPVLPARPRPDITIYTAADQGVEPPHLLSAGIPEWLIRGFEIKQNQVELVISDKGEVQQARMIGPPQRMPDIMLISRIKEMLFEPAVRNGVPVRYRLTLSWNVTP